MKQNKFFIFAKTLLFLFAVFTFFGVNLPATAADYTVKPSGENEFGEDNRYFNPSIGTFTDTLGNNPGQSGYYTICTGTYCAVYNENNTSDPSDDKLVGISDKDNYYEFNQPVAKDGTSDYQALDKLVKEGKVNDSNIYKNLVRNDTEGGSKQTAKQWAELRKKISSLEDQINDLQNKEGKTDEDEAKLEQLKKEYAATKDQYDQLLGVAASQRAAREQQERDRAAANATPQDIWCLDQPGADKDLFEFNPEGCAIQIGQIILKGAAWILWAAAKFFDITIQYSLINIKELVEKTSLITIGWQVFRDIANIIFIFLLLIISINIILGSSFYVNKSLIPKILLTAVFINFSLFFTNVIIDSSNILALQFYGTMRGTDAGGDYLDGKGLGDGIAGKFMNGLGIVTIYNSSNNKGETKTPSLSNLLIATFGGIVLILVAAFVFFAGAIMFLLRTGVLMILMIFSPLAFAAGVLPNFSGKAKDWWSQLFKHSFFAPAYLAIMYVVIVVITDPNKRFLTSAMTGNGFTDLFAGKPDSILFLFQYALLIFFMCAGLVIASNMGAIGSKKALSIGKGIRGKALSIASRSAIGAPADFLARSGFMKTYAGTRLGRIAGGGVAMRALKGLSDTKFFGQSYSGAIDEKSKNLTKMADYISQGARRRPWENDDKFEARKEAYKRYGDNYVGMAYDKNGKPVSRQQGLTFFTRASMHAHEKAAAERAKKKESEKKKKDQTDTLKKAKEKWENKAETLNKEIESAKAERAKTSDAGEIARLDHVIKEKESALEEAKLEITKADIALGASSAADEARDAKPKDK